MVKSESTYMYLENEGYVEVTWCLIDWCQMSDLAVFELWCGVLEFEVLFVYPHFFVLNLYSHMIFFLHNMVIFISPFLTLLHWKSSTPSVSQGTVIIENYICIYLMVHVLHSPFTIGMNEYFLDSLYGDLILPGNHFYWDSALFTLLIS
jgi:hypothetical protein